MLSVTSVAPEERHSALRVLYAHLPEREQSSQVETTLDEVAAGRLWLDGLLWARVAGRPAGAILVVLQPSGTAFVWPPAVLPGAHPGVCAALFTAARNWLRGTSAELAQCLIEPEATAARETLEQHGFPPFAGWRLRLRTWDAPLPVSVALPGEMIPFHESLTQRFAEVLDLTYEGSQDCPRLNGFRAGAQSLAGHRLAGAFDPRCWHLYRADGRDLGVVLMAPHPAEAMRELVYLGIVPQARGKGLGHTLLLTALHAARDAGTKGVYLAVDAKNTYACEIYERLGFAEFLRRAVHIWLIEPRGNA